MSDVAVAAAGRVLGLPDDAREYTAVPDIFSSSSTCPNSTTNFPSNSPPPLLQVRDILLHFRVASVRLMTNNPRKV